MRLLEASAAAGETAPYRAPEQVRGESADARSDIFAFGAILYEMATGRRAFEGSGDDLSRHILQETPQAPRSSRAYAAMASVISACLEKRPEARRQRMQNAVAELKLIRRCWLSTPRPRAERKKTPAWVAALGGPDKHDIIVRLWLIAITAVAAVVTVLAGSLLLEPRRSLPVYSFQIEAGEANATANAPAISPNGAYVVFTAARTTGRPLLWLRAMSNIRAAPIAGTEGGSSPFWSRDGNHIGFFANKALKTIARTGGKPETICVAGSFAGGASWSEDGVILFAPSLGGGLYLVRGSADSHAEPLLQPDPAKSEVAFLWPQFLPDQEHFLFYAQTDSPKTGFVSVGSLGSKTYERLFPSETNAVFSPIAGRETKAGYLLYMRDRTLMAQSFDPSHLTVSGDPFPALDDIGAMTSISRAPISVSQNSALAYRTVGQPTRQLVWVDRRGEPIASVGESGEWGDPRVSPDGSRALAARTTPEDGHGSLWLVDASGTATPLTATRVHQGSPVWASDGTRFAYFQQDPGTENFHLYSRAISNPNQLQLLLSSGSPKYLTDWSHDGQYLLYNVLTPDRSSDLWVFSMSERRAGLILGTAADEGFGALSPDNRWLAFQSDASGRSEIYVQGFAGIERSTRRQWRLSSGGGGHPRWRADGKELFYLTPEGGLMAVPVNATATDFGFEPPHLLFHTRALPRTWNRYDVSGDGRRFLLNLPLELTDSSSIGVLTNWLERAPAPGR